MSKLWVFGDSYGVHIAQNETDITPWFWAYDLAKKLGCKSYQNHSQMGISNEYTHYKINQYKDQISFDDYIIVITTSFSRRWFFKDRPFISNFYINNFNHHTKKEEFDAVKNYVLHLNNPELHKIYFEDFLGWLHFNSIKNSWNLLIIPGFEGEGFDISYKYNVIGSLFNVCYGEFRSDEDQDWFYNNLCNNSGLDIRAGHLLKDNHVILTKKLYDTFKNNHTLNLNKDFIQKFIFKENKSLIMKQVPTLTASNGIIKGFVPKL